MKPRARILLLLPLVLSLGCRPSAAESRAVVGGLVPDRLSSDGTTILWLTDADACLSCTSASAARTLRQINARWGAEVSTVVYAIGDPTEAVESFIRAERVVATVRAIDRAEYRAIFGDEPVPAIWLAHDGRFVLGYHDSPTNRVRQITSRGPDIIGTLEQILGQGSVPPLSTPHRSPP